MSSTRRRFLKVATASSAALYLSPTTVLWSQRRGARVGNTLRPDVIRKFVTPLVIPPVMPKATSTPAADSYVIGVRQFDQQILPAPHRRTPVWGYGAVGSAATFHSPSFTIEAVHDRRTEVTWVNQLVDAKGRYRPHLLPVDQTLHWANPPGGLAGRDGTGADAAPYRGPVPIVTHVHGAHSTDDSDGYPEAWYLPAATDIPSAYATTGHWYDFFRAKSAAQWGETWAPGTAKFVYANDQSAATLWYHDHTLGMTRVNVYAGPAGFYLLRGGVHDLSPGLLPGPAPAAGDPPGRPYYEIPIAIQDRSFKADGSLFYPDNRAFFEGLTEGQLKIPYIPDAGCDGPSDVSPIWNPEFFGDVMMVNGRTWPYLEIEQRRYRLRLLNGCDSRFLILQLSRAGLPFWQIGGDGGFLAAPIRRQQILLGPAERADVIVDFTQVPVGTEVLLQNLGPDEPFSGGIPGRDFDAADPETTGQVLQFRVVPARSVDVSIRPEVLALPARVPLPATTLTRQVSLNEAESSSVFVSEHPGHGHPKRQPANLRIACADPNREPFGPTMALLGTVTAGGQGHPLRWADGATENPGHGVTEIWEIHNFTADAHPIHVHMVQFEIVDRQDAAGVIRPPDEGEGGVKDTVIAYPGEITRIKATFDIAGQYVWHCHIISHEDNEMMRPLVVGAAQTPTVE